MQDNFISLCNSSLPEGGTEKQILVKNSSTNYDVEWGTFLVSPPEHYTSAGTINDIAVDTEYLYICTQTGTEGNAIWKRIALTADTW